MSDEGIVVLNAGCGGSLLPPLGTKVAKEIRMDIEPGVNPDIVASLTAIPLADESVDMVFCKDALEHLYPHEVVKALKEFCRVARNRAVIVCPDLNKVAELILAGDLEKKAYDSPAGPIHPIEMLYGHFPSVISGNLNMAHHYGFTPETLCGHLIAAGFKRAGYHKPSEFDILGIGYKA